MQNEADNALILCPTKRLARSLQLAHDHVQQASGLKQWQPLNVLTLDQWLDQVLDHAFLLGELTTAQRRLSLLEERLIWQSVIAKAMKQRALGDLFDLKGLADTCIEANRYMVAWRLSIANKPEVIAEETVEFLAWQQAFRSRCQTYSGLESVRYFDWQIQSLARGAGLLPAHITFTGFDQTAPQEVRLRDVLSARGCIVETLAIGLDAPGDTQHIALADEAIEMRAMVAWAKQAYDTNPNVKLAMVVPQLTTLRNKIVDLIDDVFQPEAIRPSLVESPRLYNFSLGQPLIQQPVIQAAINLLRQFYRHDLTQTDLSELLLSSYWSASETEADHRALLDAKMREYLPQNLYWPRLMQLIHSQTEYLKLPQLTRHINEALHFASEQAKRQVPSAWAQNFKTLLALLHWSGERMDSSHEYQAKEAWETALQAFGKLDFLGDKLTASGAVALLQQICQEQVFQPETKGDLVLQVLGVMEALSAPVDAMWVMGMNDVHWPMPARPNPLLPAQLQRAARVANADSAVQTAFALTIHQRLIHSAKQVIFSSSLMSGDKTLRASPLMQAIPEASAGFLVANSLAETLSTHVQNSMQWLDDDIAPVVAEGEHVKGGTGLIRAQAICPAWAFYQYRLGARALCVPKNGLNAAERGQLVHGALEAFWVNNGTYRHFSDLQQFDDIVLNDAISDAVNNSISEFKKQYKNVFSTNTLMLEHERICRLLADWLEFEKTRKVRFTLTACEVEKKVLINGIEVTLKIDRVHRLEAGGVELVDYKTGQTPNMSSWGDMRITEPQLPIYAVFYTEDNAQVEGVQFGMVKMKKHGYTGVSIVNFEADIEKRKPEFIRAFEDWDSLKAHWRLQIEAMVQTIKEGDAVVKFSRVSDLLYCEVNPLLRLPERQLQFERYVTTPTTNRVAESGSHD